MRRNMFYKTNILKVQLLLFAPFLVLTSPIYDPLKWGYPIFKMFFSLESHIFYHY